MLLNNYIIQVILKILAELSRVAFMAEGFMCQLYKLIFIKSHFSLEPLQDNYVKKNKDRETSFVSMGQLRYLSTLQFVVGVVGNSSSGLIEVSSFKIGTINIGDRQRGRIKADSVIDCSPYKNDITKAFEKLFSSDFQNNLKYVDR